MHKAVPVNAPLPNTPVDTQTLLAAVPRLQGHRVLVLGDVMLDMYVEGDAHRISPEAPVPVVNIARERRMLGGAANVARNIRALGGTVHCIGVCGPGRDGDILCHLLHEAGIDSDIVRVPERKTSVKTRIMARGQQMMRLDKEYPQPLNNAEHSSVCKALERGLPLCSVVVISDYAKGCITPDLSEVLRGLVRGLPVPPRILVDPKPHNAACYHGVSLLTPNLSEAAQLARLAGLAGLTGMELQTREDIVQAGRTILRQYACEELLITLGNQGMALFQRDGAVWNIPTAAKAVFDVTGAGDTVVATIALALAAGLDMPVACALANYAAGGVLEHVGVAALGQDALSALVQHGTSMSFTRWG